MYAVILAGGTGTRFWPYSRPERPKQFLDITGEGSMLAGTYRRVAALVPPERILVLTLASHESRVRSELPQLAPENIFAEPVGRNTAPSLALGASLVDRRGGDQPILCCPADHLIRDEESLRRVVDAAERMAAERDVLVTFGIKPRYPATGYGYIEAGPEVAEHLDQPFHRVVRFREKPDRETAEEYCRAERYYWNSGIFLWRSSVFLAAWERYVPEGSEPLRRIAAALGTREASSTVAAEYPRLPAISVDYAILEKASNAVVCPVDCAWNDVGSWDALFEVLPADGNGNVAAGELEAIEAEGNLFFNPGGLTAAIGVRDTIVVVEKDAVLVCRRGQSQRVRELIETLRRRRTNEP